MGNNLVSNSIKSYLGYSVDEDDNNYNNYNNKGKYNKYREYSEYRDMLNLDFDDDSEYVQDCIRKYVNLDPLLKNRNTFYDSEFTFVSQNGFDVMVTKGFEDDDVCFLKELYRQKDGSLYMSAIITEDSTTVTMDSRFNPSLFYLETKQDNNKLIYSREKYIFSDQPFIDKSFKNNHNIINYIYTPYGEVYCTCGYQNLNAVVERFLREYKKEIWELTYKNNINFVRPLPTPLFN